MSLTEASALLAKQDKLTLQFEEHDPSADHQALEALADWCQRYSPIVGLETATPASALLLEIGGSALRLGGETQLVQRACREFAQRHLKIRAAVADTVGAAWGAAHFGELFANQYLIVPRGAAATAQALGPLPIEALRLDDDTITTLHALGVCRVQQLLQLPRDGLATRLGELLLMRLDQSLGRAPEPIVIYRSPPPLTVEHLLEHPTARIDLIEALLRQLLVQLAQRLRIQQRGALQLECRLATAPSQPPSQQLAIQIGLFDPTAVADHLFELLQLQLEHHRLPASVHCVSLAAHVTAPLAEQQSALLDELPSVAPKQLTHLVNRLSSRLGNKTVVTPRLVAAAQPEDAFCYVPLTGARRSSTVTSRRKSPGLRPLRLLPNILALRAASVIPDGPPISFEYCGTTHRIAHCWGPERIETGWWKGAMIHRDYYRVEDQQGKRFWIFRDLTNGDWFLHGVFG